VAELDRAVKELADCGARGFRDQAVRSLRRLGRRVPGVRAGAGLGSLTRREHQIAELLSEGKTNRQLAEQLFLSEKTVETHLSHIFAKLGVSSRTAAAAEFQRLRGS
jgi:DNA-binding NarL/FixJ family response regulator